MDSDIRLLLSKTEDFAMTEKQKKMLGRIIAAFVLFVALLIAEHTGMLENVNVWIQFVIYLVPYLIIGYDIVYKAVRNISHGQVFDENFLMMVATVGAFGVQEFSEAVAVMLFYQVGELFQSYAVGKSRQSISAMMDICPEYANIEQNGVLLLALSLLRFPEFLSRFLFRFPSVSQFPFQFLSLPLSHCCLFVVLHRQKCQRLKKETGRLLPLLCFVYTFIAILSFLL